MSPEGRKQAKQAGVDVNDAVERAYWRAECLMVTKFGKTQEGKR